MVNRLIQVNAESAAISRPCTDKLFSVFKDNLEVQGSSFACFEDYVHRIKKEHKLLLIAQEDGFLYVDLESLRSLMVQIQNRFSSPERLFPDPCGIILKHKSGIYVYKGDILATVRCADNLSGEMLRGAAAALRVMHEPIPGIHFREVSYV
jgi:thymidine phosphorylase